VIAGYSDYLTLKNELYGDACTAFMAKAVDLIDKFEITSTYDETKYGEFMTYFNFINNNNLMSRWLYELEAKGISAKMNAMLSSRNIYVYFAHVANYTDAEKDSETKSIYSVIYTDGAAFLSYDYPDGVSDETKAQYEGWIIDLDKFVDEYNARQAEYDEPVKELKAKLDGYVTDGVFDYGKLTIEAYNEIVALEQKAQTHIADLITTEYTDDWGYAYTGYTGYYTYLMTIELWYKLYELKATYPAASAVTDLDGLYKVLYSYYDVDKKEYVNGIDYYYNTLDLTYGSDTYAEYTALFAEEETDTEGGVTY